MQGDNKENIIIEGEHKNREGKNEDLWFRVEKEIYICYLWISEGDNKEKYHINEKIILFFNDNYKKNKVMSKLARNFMIIKQDSLDSIVFFLFSLIGYINQVLFINF